MQVIYGSGPSISKHTNDISLKDQHLDNAVLFSIIKSVMEESLITLAPLFGSFTPPVVASAENEEAQT
jgi:hypothetical protein